MGSKTIVVIQDNGGDHYDEIYSFYDLATTELEAWEHTLEVGEATLASWEHTVEMYYRMQSEIKDMLDAKRQAL